MSRVFTFEIDGQSARIDVPDPGNMDIASLFLVGLPKAGSTLLNRVMRPIAVSAGLSPFSLHNEMRGLGIAVTAIPPAAEAIYEPRGYAYTGFHGLGEHSKLPRFASGHTVHVVRDPRDMVVSRFFSDAYSHRPPGNEVSGELVRLFEEQRNKLQSMPIDQYVLETATETLDVFKQTEMVLAAIEHRTWRYEDIVFEKLRWVREMTSYLQLDVREEVIRRTVERNDITPTSEQITEHVRRVTPGDHKVKLQPDTIAFLDDLFAPVLKRYKYV